MSALILPVKRKWFEPIRSGNKREEFRLQNQYWSTRLVGREFDKIIITLGYPKADHWQRRLEFPWRGFRRTVITSEEWKNRPRKVFAIALVSLCPCGAHKKPIQPFCWDCYRPTPRIASTPSHRPGDALCRHRRSPPAPHPQTRTIPLWLKPNQSSF